MAQTETGSALLLFVIVGIITFGGFWAVSTAVSDVSNETSVSEIVEHSEDWQFLGPEDADRFAGATVTNSSGDELQRDSDYFWNESDGAIRFNQTLTDPESGEIENATVKTTAFDMPSNTGPLMQVAEPIMMVPGWMLLIIGAGLLLIGLREIDLRQSRGGFP